MFKIGVSLNGIIADWSDQQANGLEIAIGKTMANEILEGCQVWTKVAVSYQAIALFKYLLLLAGN